MPRDVIFTRSRARYFTPPPELRYTDPKKHIETPTRAAVLATKMISQQLGISIPQKTVEDAFGVSPRSQRRILSSKQPRRLKNRPDSLDLRGSKRSFWCSDSDAIGRDLDDPTVKTPPSSPKTPREPSQHDSRGPKRGRSRGSTLANELPRQAAENSTNGKRQTSASVTEVATDDSLVGEAEPPATGMSQDFSNLEVLQDKHSDKRRKR